MDLFAFSGRKTHCLYIFVWRGRFIMIIIIIVIIIVIIIIIIIIVIIIIIGFFFNVWCFKCLLVLVVCFGGGRRVMLYNFLGCSYCWVVLVLQGFKLLGQLTAPVSPGPYVQST